MALHGRSRGSPSVGGPCTAHLSRAVLRGGLVEHSMALQGGAWQTNGRALWLEGLMQHAGVGRCRKQLALARAAERDACSVTGARQAMCSTAGGGSGLLGPADMGRQAPLLSAGWL